VKTTLLLFILALLSACNNKLITTTSSDDFKYSNIQSDYIVTDANHYSCEKIDESTLIHILKTGIPVTPREIHDNFDTTGCSIKGELSKNGEKVSFSFDYGGIFYFSDQTFLGCGKKCCENNFIYCTYSENGLKAE
jgi:hypothetical protein